MSHIEPGTYTTTRVDARAGELEARAWKPGDGPRPPVVPAAILADPIVKCPKCNKTPVLKELRTMTGGKCYGCWLSEQREGRS